MAANSTLAGGFDPTISARDLVPITPNDNTDLPEIARAIRVGTGGTLRFTSLTGQVRNTTVVDGERLEVFAIRVHATGTSATGLEAMI